MDEVLGELGTRRGGARARELSFWEFYVEDEYQEWDDAFRLMRRGDVWEGNLFDRRGT